MGQLSDRVTRAQFDAVLFDLDGVITMTAKVHAKCWQQMFDEYLGKRAKEREEPFQPFDSDRDYRLYVDGMPRVDGVRSFLASRDITLEEGTVDSPPDSDTVYGLGNRKNVLIHQVLQTDGVEVFQGTLDWITYLHEVGIRTAVVSSSKNCEAILKVAGISDLFEVRVDGVIAGERSLPGKPAPDTFLEGAREMGVTAQRSVVVEDAIVGVQAGRAGEFGLVIGVDRHGEANQLKENGADIVVQCLSEMIPRVPGNEVPK
jgi:beta-phosphoglucomutase family hydrolase